MALGFMCRPLRTESHVADLLCEADPSLTNVASKPGHGAKGHGRVVWGSGLGFREAQQSLFARCMGGRQHCLG